MHGPTLQEPSQRLRARPSRPRRLAVLLEAVATALVLAVPAHGVQTAPVAAEKPAEKSAPRASDDGPRKTTDAPSETTDAPSETTDAPSETTKPAQSDAPAAASSESPRDRVRADAEAALHRSLIPQAMEPAAFSAFLASIDPALTSSEGLVDAFATYTAAMKALAADPGRRMLQLAPAAYLFDGAKEAFAPRATPELVTLLSLRDDAVRDAEKAEKALLVAVEAATPGESRRRFVLERLRLEMGRMPTAALLPSTTLSVADIVAKLKFGPDAMLSIGPTLDSYAARMTDAARARRGLLRDNDALRASVETTAGTLWRYGDRENAAETARALAEIDDGEFAQELEIREIHFDAVARLRARLGALDARRLVESFQRSLHPDLFEDERVLGRIAEELLALPSLDADRTQVAIDVLELSYQRLEPLGRAACEAADLVLPRVLAGLRDDGALDSSGAYLDEIRGRIALLDVQRRRRVALKESMQRLRAVLGDGSAELAARFEDLASSMQASERADIFERRALATRDAEIVALLGEGLPVGLAQDTPAPESETDAAGAPSATGRADDAPGQRPTTQDSQRNRSPRGTRRGLGSP